MEEYPNKTDDLKAKFQDLKSNWKGDIQLALASENMLDNLFEERLEANDFLPIGEGGNHLLVETSYFTPPYAMDQMLEGARKKGYNLILAHPERYNYMGEKDYLKLKEQGIKFQLNILSLIGVYGDISRKKAEWLVSKGFIDFTGTDIHRLTALGHHNLDRVPEKIIQTLPPS